MAKKRADEVEEGDVVVDRLSFLRIVLQIATFPMKLDGKVIGLAYRDHGSEFYDEDHDVTVLGDENDR